MDSQTAELPSYEAERSREDEKRRALESVAGTFYALKRLIAEYDRLKAERDVFERKITTMLDENKTLRKEIERMKGQRDHLSKVLSTLTAHLDTLASRFVEAVKTARLQAYGERPDAPDERRSVRGWDRGRHPQVSVPNFLRESPEEFQRVRHDRETLSKEL